MIYFFTALIVLDTAHTLSPMVMAWSRGDFRAGMVRRWPWYILVPLIVLAISLAAATQSRAVVGAVVTVYFAWNVWHFASQNYGLLRLWQMRHRVRTEEVYESSSISSGGISMDCSILSLGLRIYRHFMVRNIDWPFCMAMTIVGMVVWPVLASDPWSWRLINLAIFAIPHWGTEIFLTSWASTRWRVFTPVILAAGCVGFLWAVPRSTGMPVVGLVWVCWRAGLGFVHFIYDGLLWRFRDPEIRATIGKELLA